MVGHLTIHFLHPLPPHRVIPYLISSDVFTRLQHVQVTLLPPTLRKNVEKTISVPIFLQKHIFVGLVFGRSVTNQLTPQTPWACCWIPGDMGARFRSEGNQLLSRSHQNGLIVSFSVTWESGLDKERGEQKWFQYGVSDVAFRDFRKLDSTIYIYRTGWIIFSDLCITKHKIQIKCFDKIQVE